MNSTAASKLELERFVLQINLEGVPTKIRWRPLITYCCRIISRSNRLLSIQRFYALVSDVAVLHLPYWSRFDPPYSFTRYHSDTSPSL